MRFSVRLCLWLVAGGVLLVCGVRGQAVADPKDEIAVRELIAAYAEARENRDTGRLSSILAPDADQLVSSGEWRKGRDDLVRGMLASSARNTGTRTLQVETIRFIAPGVAIADARYAIGASDDAQARRMWSTFVVTGAGAAWRIQAIRNMLPAPGR